MAAIMAVFSTSTKKKDSEFEKWLFENGFFYMKTKDNRPCFKSKLTQSLEKQFKMEKTNKKNKYSSVKIFSFNFRG